MISFGILGCGVLEAAGVAAVSVAKRVDCRLSFGGFELIPSRDGGIIDYPGRSCGRTGCRKLNCTDNSEHFAVSPPPKDYLLGPLDKCLARLSEREFPPIED